MKKKNLIFILKFIVTALVIYLIIRKLNIQDFMDHIKEINIIPLIIVVIIAVIKIILIIYSWNLVIKLKNTNNLYSYYFTGMFFSNILPSIIGCDLVRIWYSIKKEKISKLKAFSGVFVPRIWAMLFFSVFGIIGLIFKWNVLSDHKPASLIFLLVYLLVILGIIMVLFPKILNFVYKKRTKIKFLSRFFDSIKKYSDFKREFLKDGKNYTKLVLSIFLIHIITLAKVYLYAKSVGIELDIMYLIFFFSAVSVISALPISLNGLGITELSFTFFLGLIGIAFSQGFLISILSRLYLVILGLIGAFFFLFHNRVNISELKKDAGYLKE